MTKKRPAKDTSTSREDRLRAALRANLARRKAQARAQQAGAVGEETRSDSDSGAEKETD